MDTASSTVINIEALNNGNRQAFNHLFLQFYPALCLFAERIVDDPADAEDIVEDMFVKLWHKPRLFESSGHLRAFLYRCTKNACLDFIKTSRRANERNTLFSEELGYSEESYLNEIIRTEVIRDIYQAIQELPPQCSKVISMSYVDGLSNAEIAVKMGLAVKTVKNQKLRGLTLLRNRLPHDRYLLLILVPYLHLFDHVKN